MEQSPLQKTFVVELALLKALAIREHYENYFGYVLYDRLLEETKIFLECYRHYFDIYREHSEIDFNTFLTQFTTNWHSKDMNEEQLTFFTQAIIKVKDAGLDDAEAALLGLINLQLENKLNFIFSKPFDSEIIRKELDIYDIKRAGIIKDCDNDVLTCDDVDFAKIDKSLGIPYCMEPLNDSLGGMVPGSLVLINAASGLGKTALCITQEVHTLKWLAKQKRRAPVLVFTTEGTRDERFGRMWSNLYQNKFEGGYRDVMKYRDKLVAHYKKHFGREAYLVFTANDMGINFIRMKIKKYKPALVILDMAAAIMTSVGKSSGETQDMKVFFNTLRRLTSDNCPIWATVQAGAGAKWWDKDQHKYLYKQWPTDDDIYGSKSAVQGAAETIITIGRDNDHEFDRYVQTTKFKSDCDAAKFKCEIIRKYSHYEFVQNMGVFRDE